MRTTYNRVYLHLVWATWDRLPLLTPDMVSVVYPSILEKCAALGCRVEALGGVENHVHLVVHFPATLTIAQLVQEVKGASSHRATTHRPELFFRWQGAYAVFSVNPEELADLIHYVQNQEAHHQSNRWEPYLENLERNLK